MRFPAPSNPDRVWEVIRLREQERWSYERIAKAIGISRVAVRLLYVRWGRDPWRDPPEAVA